jgi:alkaline phosphatase D
MSTITRRAFLAMAAAVGATAAWGSPFGKKSHIQWRERRDLFPEGVASGDPDSNSVLLWTRRTPPGGPPDEKTGLIQSVTLNVEVSADEHFRHVVATAAAPVSAASDWTCRVLVGGLKPGKVYWYRFSDPEGFGSRVGRTVTAPAADDPRPVRFVFVSCQNANDGAQNAYRRMIFEDARAPEAEQIGFVLHLGDFIYEIVWYPEDRPQGMYDRRLRDIALPARRKDSRLSYSDHCRRLSRRVSGVPERS